MTAELGHSRTVFLTGPTASGKTALGVALAEHLGAEIVSMDSMALYRRMDIGTAKPSPVQRHRVPHHLIDVLDPWEDCSLTDYLAKAADAAERIRAAGRIALFVGGTPLYLKALLHGVDSGPPPDPELRARLAIEASEHGNAFLHERLAQVDPAAARRIHSNDLRRITRALEVFEKTGRPISASQVHFHNPPDAAGPVYCLDVSRDELYRRIDDRVEAMFRNGLVDEVRELLRLPHPLSRTARQALGYKEVIDHLEGRRDLAETIELVQRRSRQFAKRQLTWFRSLKQCRWLSVKSDQDPVAFAEVIARVALGDFIRRLF
jgi:tRNA dimethylallyltransferase